jgi:hypothetical protein
LPLQRGDNLKIQKVSNSEKIQKVKKTANKKCLVFEKKKLNETLTG